MKNEKRRFPRIEGTLVVRYQNKEGLNTHYLIDEISMGGCFLPADHSKVQDSEGVFHFSVPDGSPEYSMNASIEPTFREESEKQEEGFILHFMGTQGEKEAFHSFLNTIITKPNKSRRYRRASKLLSVEASQEGVGNWQTKILEISLGGAMLDLPVNPNLGEIITLKLRTSSNDYLELESEVRNFNRVENEHYHIGLKFVNLDEFKQKRLKKFLSDYFMGDVQSG